MTREVMFNGQELTRDDHKRLSKQHEEIKKLMLDGNWRTLREIAGGLRYPEASVSAQLRHLRKPRFGAYVVERRRRDFSSLYEYRVQPRASSSQHPIARVLNRAINLPLLEQELRALKRSKRCSQCRKQTDFFEKDD